MIKEKGKTIAILLSALALNACSSVKVADGDPHSTAKAYAVIRLVLNVDMNTGKSNKNERQCPVQVTLEGLSGENTAKEVLVPYVRDQQATIISLPPGDYYLKKVSFCLNNWTENYDYRLTAFRVHQNYLNYPGDWHLTTVTERKDDPKVSDETLSYGVKSSTQNVVFNPAIVQEVQTQYPLSYSGFPKLAKSKLTVTN